MKIYYSPPHVSLENILITKIRFARYHPLLASSSAFMTNSLHLGTTRMLERLIFLGTVQIWRNLNEHYYY